MCGIVGFRNVERTDFVLDETLLTSMHEALAHRGPDGHATWIDNDDQIGFGFARLSIIDLSNAGMQPMHDAQKTIVVVFNGEIYNYQEVKTQLLARGHIFLTATDTEVIINAYKEWGIACLDHLDGMFAIALYDRITKKLFLVRDRIGVKPLYFSLQGGMLNFASEIKALQTLPWITSKLSAIAAYHYLTFLVSPAPYTIFEGIYKLPAGFYVECNEHKQISFHQWYSPLTTLLQPISKELLNEHACIEHITTLLTDAVKKRLVADVPVGAFLSGGIDSSLNVALMAQFAQKTKTFTARFAGHKDYDEGIWAQRVASHFGTDHHEIIIDEQAAHAFYPDMVRSLDEPLADCVCIPFYFVSKLARDTGIKVVQVGEGADELFFGYPLYGKYKQVYDWIWHPTQQFVPNWLKKTAWKCAKNHINPQRHSWQLAYNLSHNDPMFFGGAVGFAELEKHHWWPAMQDASNQFDPVIEKIFPGMPQGFDTNALLNYHLEKLFAAHPGADIGQQMLFIELTQRLPELLLMRADKMSMAASVEAREPLLDYKLVEFMMHIPMNLRYKQNIHKYLLKKVAEKFLPHDIIHRRKVGFGAPTAHWMTHGKFFTDQRTTTQTSGCAPMFPSPTLDTASAKGAVQQWILHQLHTFSSSIKQTGMR